MCAGTGSASATARDADRFSPGPWFVEHAGVQWACAAIQLRSAGPMWLSVGSPAMVFSHNALRQSRGAMIISAICLWRPFAGVCHVRPCDHGTECHGGEGQVFGGMDSRGFTSHLGHDFGGIPADQECGC